MKIFIKILLLAAIAVFALFNYRIISFDKGISKTSMENMSVIEVLKTVTDISKVEYYQMPFTARVEYGTETNRPANYQPADYIYRVYIVTSEEAYLLKATQDDIDAFKTLGLFSKNLKPNKISPIPYFVEIIVGVVILFIPFGRKKKKPAEQKNN